MSGSSGNVFAASYCKDSRSGVYLQQCAEKQQHHHLAIMTQQLCEQAHSHGDVWRTLPVGWLCHVTHAAVAVAHLARNAFL